MSLIEKLEEIFEKHKETLDKCHQSLDENSLAIKLAEKVLRSLNKPSFVWYDDQEFVVDSQLWNPETSDEVLSFKNDRIIYKLYVNNEIVISKPLIECQCDIRLALEDSLLCFVKAWLEQLELLERS